MAQLPQQQWGYNSPNYYPGSLPPLHQRKQHQHLIVVPALYPSYMMDSTRSLFNRRLTTENTVRDKVEVKAASSYIFFPWTNGYKSWWTFTVFAAAFTAFLETYQMAFSVGWNPKSGSAVIDYILLIVFLADMIVNFNLAYYNESSKLIFVRRDIARHYFKGWFWCVN